MRFLFFAIIFLKATAFIKYCDSTPPPILNDEICGSFTILNFVQSVQFNLALEEIESVRDVEGFIYKAKKRHFKTDLLFYHQNFSFLSVGGLSLGRVVLTYYRILKNASFHIFSLLHRLALQEKLTICPCPIEGPSSDKYFSALENMHNSGSIPQCRKHCGDYLQKFSFTFVRNPIPRFISAYTEIEHLFDNNRNQHGLPIYGKKGSIARLQEFIRVILNSRGSSQLFERPHHQMKHVAAQIGPLISAYKTSNQRIHVYKMEDLENEWSRLARDSNISTIASIYFSKQLFPHESSKDGYHTTAIAKQFFAPVLSPESCKIVDASTARLYEASLKIGNITAYSVGNGPLVCEAMFNKAPYRYLRALCRVYLVDFICMGYEMPFVCSDIAAEAEELISRASKSGSQDVAGHREWESMWSKFALLGSHVLGTADSDSPSVPDILRVLLPRPVFYVFAMCWCVFASSPQCLSDLVYEDVFDHIKDEL